MSDILMRVGDLEVKRENLNWDTIEHISLDNPAIHAWVTMWRSYRHGISIPEALIGMVISLDKQLKLAERAYIAEYEERELGRIAKDINEKHK